MSMNRHAWIPILALMGVAGCGKGGGSAYQPKPVPKVEAIAPKEGIDQNLIPLDEGNQWTYTEQVVRVMGTQRQQASVEQIFRVTKSTRTPEGVKATIELSANGKLTDRQVWLANDKGLYMLSQGLNDKPFTPPQPVILYPVEAGKSFKWQGSSIGPDGKTSTSTIESNILGNQEVDTETSHVSAIAIESKISFDKKDQSESSTMWVQPGTGIVRLVQQVVAGKVGGQITLKLKSYSLKKA